MDIGFSRRAGHRAQRQAQADQLASLLATIAARQASTPTARVQNLDQAQENGAAAFHSGIARAILTPRQDS